MSQLGARSCKRASKVFSQLHAVACIHKSTSPGWVILHVCADKSACGEAGPGALMSDVHCAMLRLLEGIDQEVQEAPTLAGYGSAADLYPRDAYRYRNTSVLCPSEDPLLCSVVHSE